MEVEKATALRVYRRSSDGRFQKPKLPAEPITTTVFGSPTAICFSFSDASDDGTREAALRAEARTHQTLRQKAEQQRDDEQAFCRARVPRRCSHHGCLPEGSPRALHNDAPPTLGTPSAMATAAASDDIANMHKVKTISCTLIPISKRKL